MANALGNAHSPSTEPPSLSETSSIYPHSKHKIMLVDLQSYSNSKDLIPSSTTHAVALPRSLPRDFCARAASMSAVNGLGIQQLEWDVHAMDCP